MKINNKEIPEVNTSALPDIIFMLLFFFMTITVIRLNEEKISLELPTVENSQKLKYNKSFGHIYMGNDGGVLQLNDKFIKIEKVEDALRHLKASSEARVFKTKLYIDKKAEMKDVNKLKLEIRKSEALNIQYVLDKK